MKVTKVMPSVEDKNNHKDNTSHNSEDPPSNAMQVDAGLAASTVTGTVGTNGEKVQDTTMTEQRPIAHQNPSDTNKRNEKEQRLNRRNHPQQQHFGQAQAPTPEKSGHIEQKEVMKLHKKNANNIQQEQQYTKEGEFAANMQNQSQRRTDEQQTMKTEKTIPTEKTHGMSSSSSETSNMVVTNAKTTTQETHVNSNPPSSSTAVLSSSAPTTSSTVGIVTSSNSNKAAAPSSSSKNEAWGSAQKKSNRDPMLAPVRKLSVNLIHTYKHINEVYYRKKRERQAKAKALQQQQSKSSGSNRQHGSGGHDIVYNDGHDDENSDYIIKYEECLNERYIVRKRIGKGSFGQVVCAYDSLKKEDVAIKIIKSRSAFFKQANTEIDLLKFLNRKDPHDQWFIVRLKDTFVHHKHQCLVFEKLSCNLYDLLRTTRFLGVSLNLIVKFGRQILKALAFLALPEIDIVHCDLKPENILLRHHKRSAIKVIDFGSSCRTKNTVYTYIQSRFYRSPEVMLGLPYGVAIDMWSLGCILVEMHVGEPLFNGTDEFDQMSRLVAIRGLPPSRLIENAPKRRTFFEKIYSTSYGREKAKSTVAKASSADNTVGAGDTLPSSNSKTRAHSWRLRTRASKYRSKDKRRGKPRARSLEKILGVHQGGPHGSRMGESGHLPEDYYVFIDLIDRMLDYDPKTRIKPIEALNHPFFRNDSHSSSSRSSGQQKGSSSERKGGTTSNASISNTSNANDHGGMSEESNPSGVTSSGVTTDVLSSQHRTKRSKSAPRRS